MSSIGCDRHNFVQYVGLSSVALDSLQHPVTQCPVVGIKHSTDHDAVRDAGRLSCARECADERSSCWVCWLIRTVGHGLLDRVSRSAEHSLLEAVESGQVCHPNLRLAVVDAPYSVSCGDVRSIVAEAQDLVERLHQPLCPTHTTGPGSRVSLGVLHNMKRDSSQLDQHD